MLGIDIPDIRLIFHFGAPSSIDQYVQETGRAGRDGGAAEAILIRHKRALHGKVSAEMKDYVNTSSCRRLSLLKVFNVNTSSLHSSPLCCDNCAVSVSCCSCQEQVICDHIVQGCYCVRWCHSICHTIMLSTIHHVPSSTQCRELLPDIQVLESDLRSLNIESKILPDNINDIYPHLLKNIIEHYMYISNVDDVKSQGAYDLSIASKILAVIEKHAPLKYSDFSGEGDSLFHLDTDVSSNNSDDSGDDFF